jgi:hypothetical protein
MTKFTQPSRQVAVSSRYSFQFSNAAAQRAEARLNAREALALVERHAPRQETREAPATAAGACFRRVCELLSGKKPGPFFPY